MTIGVNQLYMDYTALKGDTAKIEKFRATVKGITEAEMPSAEPEQMYQKSWRKAL